MLKAFLIILITVVFIFLAFSTGDQISKLNLSLKEARNLNIQLNSQVKQEFQKKQLLKDKVQEAEKGIANLRATLQEKEIQITQLRNPEMLRQALFTAQVNIKELNKELNQIKSDKVSLTDDKLTLSSRLENTTRELIRVMDDLKLSKRQLTDIEKGRVLPLKKKIKELNKASERKKREFSKLKQELTKLQKERLVSIDATRSLEKAIKHLKAEKVSLEKNLSRLQKRVDRQNAPIQALQDDLDKLNAVLANKEKQVNSLESERESLREKFLQVEQELSRQNNMVALLKEEKEELQVQVSQLKEIKDVSGATAFYENTPDQMKRLSGILVKKELELDKARRQAVSSEEKLSSLQVELAGLEERLNQSQLQQANIEKLETEKFSLSYRLTEIQNELAKKTELVDSLQKNLKYINEELSRKEEEKKLITAGLTQADVYRVKVEKDLLEQKAQFKELDFVYGILKSQIGQISDVMAEKEMELGQRRQEVYALKGEIADLNSRSDRLEKELTKTKEHQRKTFRDLAAAISLNAALQEKMVGVSQSLESSEADIEERQKADELRRKIKVILEPD